MIDYNELISRFDDIQDLPVSEEMLGAYCEGTLNDVDAADVSNCISDHAELGELMNDVENDIVQDEPFSLYSSDVVVDDVDLPDVPTDNGCEIFDFDFAAGIYDSNNMVAAIAAPSFCGDMDDFISDADDSFPDIDDSIDLGNDINSDDSFDDLNIE